MISKDTRDALTTQALKEIEYCRFNKRKRVHEWHKNENVLFEKKINDPKDSRANIALYKAVGFVNTVLSKIDTPMTFEYVKKHLGDSKTVKYINALKEQDALNGDWDFKDILGKKQAIEYGRAVYSYFATSNGGEYRSHLENIDVYDFYIDPNAGGVDIENARYLGNYGVRLDKSQIKEGIKQGRYLRTESNELLASVGNATEITQEETDKQNREDFSNQNQIEYEDADLFEFWNWCTTYNGKRYYLLISERYKTAIKVKELSEISKDGLYPYWTYAIMPSLTEFWSLSLLEIVREIFMTQNININQMVDNAEQINKPQRAVDVGAIIDETELKFRKNGKIRFKNGTNIDQAFKIVETPSINTPIEVYQVLENIVQLVSGVTNAVQGVADEDVLGIYEGNQQAASDRFNLMNKSYSNGYKKLAILYKNGLETHLTKKTAVDILGPNGIEIVYVTKKDIKPIKEYGIAVKSTAGDITNNTKENELKKSVLKELLGTGFINDTAGVETILEMAGFDQVSIRKLTDKTTVTNDDMMAELYRDIEMVIEGKDVEVNDNADVGYMKELYKFLQDKKENLNLKQFEALSDFLQRTIPVVQQNSVFDIMEVLALKGNLTGAEATGNVGEMEELPIDPEQEALVQQEQNEV